MMGQIINAGVIITLFTIAAPFIFVLLVIKMVISGDKRKRRNRRTKRDDDSEELNEISRGLKDLRNRIDNLETINERKRNKER